MEKKSVRLTVQEIQLLIDQMDCDSPLCKELQTKLETLLHEETIDITNAETLWNLY